MSIASKELYLLRHAKSSWDDPSLADHDRPLAPRGRRACKTIAAHLREGEIAPELVLCSSSLRTRETLDRVSAGFADARTEIERGLYAVTADDLLARLRLVPDDVGSVMLINHQPAIQALALELAGEESAADHLERLSRKFPTAALASLELSGSWGQLAIGSAQLRSFVTPKQLAP